MVQKGDGSGGGGGTTTTTLCDHPLTLKFSVI
jgi:hypothetical protein